MPKDSTEQRQLVIAIENALQKASTMNVLIGQSGNDMAACSRDLARVAAQAVLDWLEETAMNAKEIMPMSGGGETAPECLRARDTIKIVGMNS